MRRTILALLGALAPTLAAAQAVQLLHEFEPPFGPPVGALVQVPDGSFYGPLEGGIYRLSTAGQVSVTRGAAHPRGPLVQGADGALYGTTLSDGVEGLGTVFRFDPASGDVRTLHEFAGPAEGWNPLGGLVAVGGALYGVTALGPGSMRTGTLFRLDIATGVLTTLYHFTDSFSRPCGPLALGPDGRLYGPVSNSLPSGNGAIYRFDPAGGEVAVVHQFTREEGFLSTALLLDGDGTFYGTAPTGGAGLAGTVFRFDPSSSVLQVLYTLDPAVDGRAPGPLVAAADGHFYGTTDYDIFAAPGTGRPATLFRVRRLGGGAVAFETVRSFDPPTTGIAPSVQMTAGTDGLVYGYAPVAGPAGLGTLYRFDPLAAGPPSDPLQFTVLHDFRSTIYFGPATPAAGPDGFLYGPTAGGPTMRGGVYRLDPLTGVATVLGDLPGGFAGTTSVVNSPLVLGPDARLYGTTTSSAGLTENRIVRVDPATGAVTAVSTTIGTDASAQYRGLVRTPAGTIYGLRRDAAGQHVFRLDPATGAIADVAHFAPTDVSPLLAGADGALYATAVTTTFVPVGTMPHALYTIDLRRINLATGHFDSVSPALAQTLDPSFAGTPVQGPAGAIYVPVSRAYASVVARVVPSTGSAADVCALGMGWPATLGVGPDGSIAAMVGIVEPTRVVRCHPDTGRVVPNALNPAIAPPAGPLADIGGVLYGARRRTDASGGALFRFSAGGSLPALDSDADGLPSAWETAYRLDPFAAAGDDGPEGDPDADGRTNAQELAGGTHPRGFVTRYFAEGATGPFFRTAIDLFNPSRGRSAIVRMRYLTDEGVAVPHDVVLGPESHVSVDPATLPGLAHANFSTVVEADTTVAVDRRMWWDASGYGSHLETGLLAPSPTWYFAEGSTSGDFSLFYLLQNPQPAPVSVTVRFLRPAGSPPIERSYTLAAGSRTTLAVDDLGPELASTDVSAVVTASAPIVAERAMYFNRPGRPFAAGHGSGGVTAPALTWFLAEGATGAFFDLFVLIANPGTADAVVDVEYLRPGGGTLTKRRTIPASSRVTIWVDDEELPAGSGQRPLAAADVSTTVRSTNGVPVIVERAMWWPGPAITADFWQEAHNSPGATTTAARWAIAGGEVGGSAAAETYVLIANPTDTPGSALVTVYRDDDGFQEPAAALVAVPAKSRTTLALGSTFFLGAGRVAVLVESQGLAPVPLVVERATYASPGGITWASGANALAAPLP